MTPTRKNAMDSDTDNGKSTSGYQTAPTATLNRNDDEIARISVKIVVCTS